MMNLDIELEAASVRIIISSEYLSRIIIGNCAPWFTRIIIIPGALFVMNCSLVYRSGNSFGTTVFDNEEQPVTLHTESYVTRL